MNANNPASQPTGYAGPMIQGVASVKPSNLAWTVLIDATASSGPFAAGIQHCNIVLANELPKHLGEIHFGLHICRDLEFDRDADFSLGEDLSAEEFTRNIQRIVFEGGGDPEETQFDSLLTIARTYKWPFGPYARRAVGLFSSSSSKNTRDNLDVIQVSAELLNLGIKVVVVAPQGVNLHELAARTGGHSVLLSNNPSQSDLDRVIALLTKSLTQMGNSSGTVALNPNTSFGARGTQRIGG